MTTPAAGTASLAPAGCVIARLLVLVSAALAPAGNVPVIRDAWRRTARPVAMSRAGWAAIMAIGAAGSAEARQLPSLVYTGLCAFGCTGLFDKLRAERPAWTMLDWMSAERRGALITAAR